jgi:hypothetical protein
MTWHDLLWLPPVMLAVALVLGAAGRTGFVNIARSVLHTFIALTVGVLVVGLVVHVVALAFA